MEFNRLSMVKKSKKNFNFFLQKIKFYENGVIWAKAFRSKIPRYNHFFFDVEIKIQRYDFYKSCYILPKLHIIVYKISEK